MRYIPIDGTLQAIFQTPEGQRKRAQLTRAHQTAFTKTDEERRAYIDSNGSSKWSSLKTSFTEIHGPKCWYTEAEPNGADLAIDHFRPKRLYWWLAFSPENYRVACPFANSRHHNSNYDCSGGKGDEFPLPPETDRATCIEELDQEEPELLDPCNVYDCTLIAFQADGRPVLSPLATEDPNARRRVELSLLRLNIDHPDFNSKREQIYHETRIDVDAFEELQSGSRLRQQIHNRIVSRISPRAPFSVAARFYLRLHRDLNWVEDILNHSNS